MGLRSPLRGPDRPLEAPRVRLVQRRLEQMVRNRSGVRVAVALQLLGGESVPRGSGQHVQVGVHHLPHKIMYELEPAVDAEFGKPSHQRRLYVCQHRSRPVVQQLGDPRDGDVATENGRGDQHLSARLR